MKNKYHEKKKEKKKYVTEICHEGNQLEDNCNQKNDQYFQLFQEMFQSLLSYLMNSIPYLFVLFYCYYCNCYFFVFNVDKEKEVSY